MVLTTDPSNPNATIARRVVGIPGDTVSVSATAIIVNGVTLNEPFIRSPPDSRRIAHLRAPFTLDRMGSILCWRIAVLGTDSFDSRAFGPVPRSNIIGRAVMVFWPLSQFHWIDTHSDDYSNIKNP